MKLEVRYDDKPVQVQFKDGKFEMPAPKPGQKLTFVLRRQAAAEGRLAVVLKVNGQNTLFRERLPDAQCRKWVLEPGKDGLTVDHILTEDPADKGELVLPVVPKAKPGEFRYGADVGTVSLVVFREAKGPETAARSAADDVAVVARAGYPNDRAKDLPALKDQLRKEAAPENAAHGFGAPAKLGGEPQEATFRADPTPVMAVTINCGRP